MELFTLVDGGVFYVNMYAGYAYYVVYMCALPPGACLGAGGLGRVVEALRPRSVDFLPMTSRPCL